ncbi:putative signal transducing protein [Varunaivibrio sulfuroxidans]|uniref:Putative signal transducing protein n=1 Tax=Varunaivibrio sulfuroxidans TaxID=1773489 RepID=A0A4R3JC21_9PROT|nr:DUF2007 domain-containing protein [Varunaivibrio sulfuroxidans]TCS62623.1 putative signal transducing protein [Varunaivibrio sulfuroxidans]WES30710.1 DUF2007 domain-containing protein [Varunaivibrio sulfuroxidans]
MIELVRTNDPVFLSWLNAHLEGRGVRFVVLDQHAALMDGSIGAVPRRVMVDEDQLPLARLILAEGEALARAED